jgi:hypothetical protein
MVVRVQDSADAVASVDVAVGELVEFSHRFGHRT